MRLNQIKLSGFKSFAEPTVFQLPGQRIGVVGPNGCGKSNIIDAVRWVLGESKASELRGESMQDVIFNGSGHRKPAGRASVELVFDNTLARAGGAWNAFAEIAVKRTLTRDGASSYFINNQPVRRRDVHDVFLGTGLGPRAYAIIGQGTISRIIESQPADLRLFLEEAAGVSKYKERRRETETRLRSTRDNLTRVDDILRELNGQLDKLQAQADVALRYRQLQEQGTLKQHQLWFLQHRDAAQEEARVQAASGEAINARESRLADLRQVESTLATVRLNHQVANDQLHDEQGRLGQAALEVSRLEERIRYVVDGRRRAQVRLDELAVQDGQWSIRRQAAAAELADNAQRAAGADEVAARLAVQAAQAALALPALQEALRTAQKLSEQQRAAVAQLQQRLQLLAAEGRSIDEQQRAITVRHERLTAERAGLQAPDAQRLLALQAEEKAATDTQARADARLQALSDDLPLMDGQRRAAQVAVNRESAAAADVSARLGALRALQERVQTDGKLKPWLARHGLAGLPALWTRLQVVPGWEPAVEAALRERLQALPVSQLDAAGGLAADPPPARLAVYMTGSDAGVAGAPERRPPSLPRLFDRLGPLDVDLQPLLAGWLDGVYTADTLATALADRARLQPGEVIICPEGHAVGPAAVALHAPDNPQAGMLARAQDIEQLARQQQEQAVKVDDVKAEAVRLETAYTDALQRLTAARRETADAQKRSHDLQVERLQLAQWAETTRSRQERLAGEMAELQSQLSALQERRALGDGRSESIGIELGAARQRLVALEAVVPTEEQQLSEAREQQRGLERQAQEAGFQARALATRRDELGRSFDTAVAQLAANAQAGQEIRLELAGLDDAAAHSGLQAALQLRLEREQGLGLARSRYDELGSQLRRVDEQRLTLERSVEPLRERIGRLQLELQAAQLGGAQVLQQLTAADVDLQALGHTIEQGGVRLAGLQPEIDRIQRDIAALGAVNLAALDELSASRERKNFLDAQNADLLEAIGTLEGAIRTIDLETRDLLASTFDQVNEHFGRLFPTLFGGGTARLVMTGAEILDAGVQVMAQPPGKKNSTIHLLSGGEKALTAIALVFAIFQLNPAPFCLLDEVDAPLDDANTERYRRLVTQMSTETQFLFISHNKIAMEMAEQLIGVTMQEQGVSRIVAVDMESALALAEVA